MNKNKALISVICTTYNHEKYIGDALDSFMIQETTFPFEVIVHDDASTDGTADIINRAEKEYSRVIKPIYQKINQYSQGINIIKNNMLPIASGKYVAICEGDDYWIDSQKLQKQITFMEKNPQCTFCFHNAISVTTEKKLIGDFNPVEKNQYVTTESVIRGMGGYCATNSIIAKKEHLLNAPLYYQNFSYDSALQIYLASLGDSYGFVDQMSAYRFGVEGSWSDRMTGGDLRKKRIEYNLKAIKMRKEFDQVTEEKYHNAIQDAILINEFEILKAKNNYRALRKYPYKKIFINFSQKRKIAIFLDCYLPNWRRVFKYNK